MASAQSPPITGYHLRLLQVDLTTGQAQSKPLEPTILRHFLGGSGLGVHLLLRLGQAAVDALSPAAPLIFSFSPLVGSPLTTSAKFAVVSKSPLTGRLNDSLASSQFALAGKRTGHDAIVLTGSASAPSVLLIDGDRVELLPAEHVWGLSCPEAEQALRHQLGNDFALAAIGPAGEQQVRYATISHDGRHAGRGGSGAVLGSKNIKAIALRGTRRVDWARQEELVRYARQLSERSFGPATAKYRELGTASNLLTFNRLHALPTRNFQQGSFASAEALSPETLSVARERTRASCAACTIGCEHIYSLTPGNDQGPGVRLEYENLFALGPLCGIGDADSVLAASHRCDELGLDTISTGGTIAFAMECADRQLIDAPWLRFGDAQALLRAIDEIGARRGLGDLLAEGSRRAAAAIGRSAIDFAPQIKGLEIPGYEPRALQTMALGFAVNARGADHNRSGAYEADFSGQVDRRAPGAAAVGAAIESEDRAALIDSLILCKFLRGVFDDLYAEAADMLRLVTGWDVTGDELRTTARRIVTAKKLFNIRAGWQPGEDTLPQRFFCQPLPDDPQARISAEAFAELVALYNRSRGWTEEGWIPPEILSDLSLDSDKSAGIATPESKADSATTHAKPDDA
jgi:aldehyde:ferredoxin oxidoreductase